MPGMKKRAVKGRGKDARRNQPGDRFSQIAADLADAGRSFYGRGWVFGTSGNFSAVVGERPLRIAITPSGADKGALDPREFLEIDDGGRVTRGDGQSSAETGLHLAIVRACAAGAVLHTHSLWSTVLSEAFAAQGAVTIEGFEMLKGLSGVTTHEHSESLPVVENSQNIPELAATIEGLLREKPAAHGFLLRRHGLYTWGRGIAEARRHVEVLEFLLEAIGRWRTGV